MGSKEASTLVWRAGGGGGRVRVVDDVAASRLGARWQEGGVGEGGQGGRLALGTRRSFWPHIILPTDIVIEK
jgi:hypothetical protein